jgi:hypothetical protein
MRTATTVLTLAFFLFSSPAWADRGFKRKQVTLEVMKKEPRVALVIGNGGYRVGPLPNARNDAREMGKALKAVGFDVEVLEDLDRDGMKQAIRRFGKRLKKDGIAVFFYAGHGLQVNGRNYLVPIGASEGIETAADVDSEAVQVNLLLGKLEEGGTRMNIVVLDACRNNPFATGGRSVRKGLAEMKAEGMYLAFATAPGKVAADGEGSNSPFTASLVRHLHTPGAKLEEVFKAVRADVWDATSGKQRPWSNSDVIGDFYFVLGAKGGAGAVVCPPGTQVVGNKCVAQVSTDCPAGLEFVTGRGCVAKVETKDKPPLSGSGLACPGGTRSVRRAMDGGGHLDLCMDRDRVARGPALEYWSNGQMRFDLQYEKGQISGKVQSFKDTGGFESTLCYRAGKVVWTATNKAKAKFKKCP